MKSRLVVLVFLLLSQITHNEFHTIQAQQVQTSGGIYPNVNYVKLPGVFQLENFKTDYYTKELLDEVTKRLPHENYSLSKDYLTDLIVIFTDSKGFPLLPDLKRLQASKTPRKINGELTFTFNSEDQPWTKKEEDTIKAILRDFYPVAKKIFGNPAFNNSVNIRKDSNISASALYFPSTNEIVLKSLIPESVVCHEMIHAFRDDFIIGLGTYEEGMTRAVEDEIYNQMDKYDNGAEHHTDYYDIYYDALNKPSIGTVSGNVLSYYALAYLRYQISSYAWAKCYIEDNDFFIKFNNALYSGSLSDPTLPYTEDKLKQLLFEIKPTIEDVPANIWYDRQHILNTNPPIGYQLYQRINQFTIDYFYRDASGFEIPQQDKPVTYCIYDYDNNCKVGGVSTTSDYGWTGPSTGLPEGFYGRIRVVCQAETPEGEISDTTFRSYGAESGIFGVITDSNTGFISVTALDTIVQSASAEIINGMFVVPQMERIRGRFRIAFTYPGKYTIYRTFTKDAGKYFISLSSTSPLVTGVDVPDDSVHPYRYCKCFPNPFGAATTFRISLESPRMASLKIFDSHGRLVCDLVQPKVLTGTNEFLWNSAGNTEGLYYYLFEAEGISESGKLIKVK